MDQSGTLSTKASSRAGVVHGQGTRCHNRTTTHCQPQPQPQPTNLSHLSVRRVCDTKPPRSPSTLRTNPPSRHSTFPPPSKGATNPSSSARMAPWRLAHSHHPPARPRCLPVSPRVHNARADLRLLAWCTTLAPISACWPGAQRSCRPACVAWTRREQEVRV